jgi:CheY-like chemotaxis protein
MDQKFNKYILIVDDTKENIELLCAIFKKYGYKYLIAKSGEESIDIVNDHDDIGLILMDVKMRGIGGVEAMKTIKKEHDIPIIAVTGYATDSDKNNLINQGFDDFISKPIDIQLLNTKIEDLIEDS